VSLWAALVGVLSAVAALAVAEAAAAFMVLPASSPLFAVGSFVIDIVPGWFKSVVIALFGTNDKIVLLLVLGVVVLSPVPATAASPNPASSCAGQLNQGATPHGLSESAPGVLGSFVSELAKAGGGAYGHVTSNLAGQHGDLFTCISNVSPVG